MRNIEWSAVWRPAVSVGVFLLPLALLQQWLIDENRIERGGSESLLFVGVFLFLAAACGFASARLASHDLPAHGAASAALAYGIVQGIGVTRHLVMGEAVGSFIAFAYLALLMSTCGMLGAMLERRMRRLEAIRD
ncbi:MAG: hypothetical protein IT195_04105 [Microthrixaceae bacterium]|nr:hypothetical protein [Microthrixaceae bacterium]